MTNLLKSLLASALVTCASCDAQLSGVAESHITANVPAGKDFRSFLIRDFTAYLKPIHGEKLALDYELLRDAPTQSGVAYPKFYLWLKATNAENAIIEGAARVAAIDKKRFEVTDFLSRSDITSRPNSVAQIFPAALLEKIHTKAGVKQ